jgi:hypothetical protein
MRDEKRIRENYKDHIVEYNKYFKLHENGGVLDEIEVIKWRKPGTCCYYIKYIIDGGFLFVSGDLGEAIYQWSDKINLEFLAKCDIYYFIGKCRASEVGRDFKDWDEERAKEVLKEYSEDHKCFSWKEFEETEGLSNLGSKIDWIGWLNDYHLGESKVLGEDFWEWAYDCGDVINIRGIYHKIGLNMAFKQLKEKEVVAK